MNVIEIRAARQVGVSYPNRTIELVVMPYEDEALVEYKGRWITEICSRGAFDGVESRPNRVKVNRDHDYTRTIGRAINFHPSREEGLVAEIKIARTELGDEALTLADDEILDASAGFGVMKDGETWETRDRRRLTKLWLDHIALTPIPAFENARVLAVRDRTETGHVRPVTPLLDQLRVQELERAYADLDNRYRVGR